MTLQRVSCRSESPQLAAEALSEHLAAGQWVQLMPDPLGSVPLLPDLELPEGPGVVLASGGSSGQTKLCFHPQCHLVCSADATANWLEAIGIRPSETVMFNPLPLHHISGLMAWWRSCQWGAPHVWLRSEWMKQPADLLPVSEQIEGWGERAALLSLVPTQLARLIDHPQGLVWLQQFSVIWVGGAPLSAALASKAREAGLRLSPCYGATETAAMVTAQTPEDFLAAERGCGSPLVDVELRLEADGALQVRSPRLAVASWCCGQADRLSPLGDSQGWWTSGDVADLWAEGSALRLNVLGRRDGALHSGGETVFPERLEERLRASARELGLPLREVVMVGVSDSTWGQRLVALVRATHPDQQVPLLKALPALCSEWSPAERPKQWLGCADLEVNSAGKWERSYWSQWARAAIH